MFSHFFVEPQVGFMKAESQSKNVYEAPQSVNFLLLFFSYVWD